MLARLPPHAPPIVHRRGAWTNLRVLQKEFAARGRPEDEPTALLAGLVRDLGPIGAAGRVDGDVAFAGIDGAGVRYVVQDAIGRQDLAWARDGEDLVVGRPGAVAAAIGAEVDDDAITSWLATGTINAPRTAWSGVFGVPAGHVLSVGPDGVAAIAAWSPARPSTPGGGSAVDLERWGKALAGVLQVGVLHRLADTDGVIAHGGDLDEAVAAMVAEKRPELPRFTGAAPVDVDADVEALVADGPAISPSALWRLAALRAAGDAGASAVFSGDGGRVLVGGEAFPSRLGRFAMMRSLLDDEVPGTGRLLRSRLAGRIGTHLATELRGRAVADDVGDPFSHWQAPWGPIGWEQAVRASRAAAPHALDRLWWLRGRVLRGLDAAERASGVAIHAPWATRAIEERSSEIPVALHGGGHHPGRLVQAALGVGHEAAPAEPPRSAWTGDDVAAVLEGWCAPDATRRRWDDPTTPFELRWRLWTLVAFRRRYPG